MTSDPHSLHMFISPMQLTAADISSTLGLNSSILSFSSRAAANFAWSSVLLHPSDAKKDSDCFLDNELTQRSGMLSFSTQFLLLIILLFFSFWQSLKLSYMEVGIEMVHIWRVKMGFESKMEQQQSAQLGNGTKTSKQTKNQKKQNQEKQGTRQVIYHIHLASTGKQRKK